MDQIINLALYLGLFLENLLGYRTLF